MATKEDLVKKATSYLGANYLHFCNSFWGGCFAWCAAFVSVVCKEAGVDAPWSTSCNAQIAEWKKRGCYYTDRNIQVGDIVYYNWDNIDDADHVGICTYIDNNGTLTITEGNYGDYANSQTKVTNRYIKTSYRYIYGYARPKFTNSTPTSTTTTAPVADKVVTIEVKQVRKGSTGTTVRRLQAILEDMDISVGKYGCDGDFGNDTENAVRVFQRSKGLDVDGICGPKTWTELLK